MNTQPMTPSRRRAPRVGVCIAVATLLVAIATVLSPLVPSVAAMIPWRGLSALVNPAGGPILAVPPPVTDPAPASNGSNPGTFGSPVTAPGTSFLYPLVLSGADAAAAYVTVMGQLPLLGPLDLAPATSPHLESGMNSDGCSSCHRGHTAQESILLTGPTAQSALCFSCHDGSGTPTNGKALTNVKAAFTNPSPPPNDATTSSYYAHPALADLAHQPGVLDEFGGTLERHSACVDCHDPHNANVTLAVPGVAGWSASGAIVGASGVRVFNGPAGATPAYTLVRSVAFEYQLCFKCHSGWTQFPVQDPTRPSTWALDKGKELNPANGSFHPIEAAGTNITTAMNLSLAGGTLWQFNVGSTVRCVNCHGDPSKAVSGTDPGARLAPHASTERGLLIAPYRDRLLKSSGAAYDGNDFTLCYLCHAQAPFTADSSGATNFDLHSKHLREIADKGSGSTDIDVAGAGQGNAICAECHFRLHSTALAIKTGDVNNTRLVNFAPNVQANGGVLRWTGASGSCTLTCHGEQHTGANYQPVAVQNAALGVDARISITTSSTDLLAAAATFTSNADLVNTTRTFTVTVEKNDVSATGWRPVVGIAVNPSESGVGAIIGGTCSGNGSDTNSSGQCTIIVSSSEPGVSAVNATARVVVEGVVGHANVDVSTLGHGAHAINNSRTWVDARITVDPSATNVVGESHTFTVTVEKDLGLGRGWIAAPGVAVSPSELGVGSIDLVASTCDDQVTDSNGQCVIVVTSTLAGQTAVEAAATVIVRGVPIDVATDGYGAHDIGNIEVWVDAP